MKKTKKPKGVLKLIDGVKVRILPPPPMKGGKISPKAIRAAVIRVRDERLAREAAESAK